MASQRIASEELEQALTLRCAGNAVSLALQPWGLRGPMTKTPTHNHRGVMVALRLIFRQICIQMPVGIRGLAKFGPMLIVPVELGQIDEGHLPNEEVGSMKVNCESHCNM